MWKVFQHCINIGCLQDIKAKRLRRLKDVVFSHREFLSEAAQREEDKTNVLLSQRGKLWREDLWGWCDQSERTCCHWRAAGLISAHTLPCLKTSSRHVYKNTLTPTCNITKVKITRQSKSLLLCFGSNVAKQWKANDANRNRLWILIFMKHPLPRVRKAQCVIALDTVGL